ncbi:MAG: efflux RND transporter periplasmic adaptor subunit [Desulfobacter sp.]|nr:MAG: efflux RND transporter periplasmic adaptor subunit [Desulfobacter sp.]
MDTPNTTVKQKTPPLRRLLRFIWRSMPFFIVLLVIALVILPLMNRINAQKAELAEKQASRARTERTPTNVVTMEMLPGPVVEKISLPGVARPWISLTVMSEVKGKIVDKRVEEGARVAKGDVLAVIDTRDYRHNYESALASFETALTNQKRFKALSKKQFITQSQLDDAEARVKTTRAAMDLAKLNMERCTIRSPMAGVVDRVHVEYGDFLDAGKPVAVILDMDRLKVEVGIPESDVAAVRKLKTFEMRFDALGGKAVTGTYNYLYKTTDSLARLYNLEIRVENPELEILPDMFARVDIVKNRADNGLAVPIYSLVTREKKTGVFVESEGRVSFRPVATGFQDGWRILAARGLAPGDHVVVVGHRLIEDGEKVNVTRTVKQMEELVQ